MLRRRRTAAAGLSLFPFLDVLCCTMGSLIMLLCVLAKAAKGDLPKPQSKQPPPDFAPVRRMLEEQLAHVRREREDVQSTLAESRMQLSHVEDHARQLREEILQLEEALAALAKPQSAGSTKAQTLAARRAEIEARLAQLREQFAQVQAAAREADQNYAIVPYDGDNATFRRPVYIECLADSVVLQPEGIVLRESDFSGPIGPGNPLAAALRATHEYLSYQAAGAATIGEPYPLLLVRPEGIGAYYAARAALKSWGSEFGYELIDSDWPLAYPEKDPQLAEAQREAVETAREKRAYLARSAPKAYGRSGGQAFHDFATGGGEDNGPPRGRGGGVGGGSGELAGGGAGLAENAAGGGPGGSETGSGGQHGTGNSSQSGEKEGTRGSGGGQSAAQPSASRNGKPGGGQARGAGAPGKPGSSTTAGGASAAGSLGQGGQGTTADKSIAEVRGRDWALPNAGPRQIAVSRPIRMQCNATQITIPNESPSLPPKVIALGERTEDAMDDLVSAIWDHEKTWGIAGNGMYWKPILKVEVAPDGVARAADLGVLLADSGLVIEAAAPATAPATVVRKPQPAAPGPAPRR